MCQCGGKCGNNCSCGKGEHKEGTCSCNSKKEPKLLYCIVGKSGSGKDTLCKLLNDRLGWKSVCSYTDRPMRVNETQGVEHQFISKEEMDKLLSQNNIMAETQIGEYRYCATTDCIDKDTKLYIVDPAGVEFLSERADRLGIKICVVYITVDSDIRLERALLRGDDEKVALKRFEAEDEMFEDYLDLLVSHKAGYPFVLCSNNSDNIENLYLSAAASMIIKNMFI